MYETFNASNGAYTAHYVNQNLKAGGGVTINLYSQDGNYIIPFILSEAPIECPRCQAHADFRLRLVYTNRVNASHAYAVWDCCSGKCGSPHVTVLVKGKNQGFIVQSTEPVYESQTIFSDNVKKISPNFVEIFNQAERANQHKLNLIAGAGFRKSYEFLIRDLARELIPNVDLTSVGLKNVIEQHIQKEPIFKAFFEKILTQKDLSAVYNLLCDEAHYTKKYATHDVVQMVNFINNIASAVDLLLNLKGMSKSVAVATK